MRTSKPLSVLLAVLTALLVLSGSIAVPLLCRPFYYAHIGPLGLVESTGLTQEQIRTAFDQVMDFCLGLRPDFAAGDLIFSQSGASHFADVRTLFLLDLWILGLSLAALAAVFVYCRLKKVRPHLFCGHGPGALDFDRAFVIFHALFFPGKTNWIFNWWEDPVILILPQTFFRNCAILILALVLVWCAVLIAADLWACRRRKRARGPERPADAPSQQPG